MLYDQYFIDDLKNRADLVRIIEPYTQLKKKGANWMGTCPFHQEKTASFAVNPSKGIYKCFGCGKGGNAFTFLMEMEGVAFPEAIKRVAELSGVMLPEPIDDEQFKAAKKRRKEKKDLADQVIDLNRVAVELWEKALEADEPAAAAAREYLKTRGISDEIRREFHIGYSPDTWDTLLNELRSRKFDEKLIEQSGLVSKNEDRNSLYDRFRGRIMFPVLDADGRPVAFGARAMGDDQPKYLNSPETPAYTKGNHLYGLFQSKEEIRKKKFAILVEGYLDLIALYQFGIRNVAASLGTAFTQDQARLLGRFSRRAVINYDGDSAGIKAAIKAVEQLLAQDIETKVLVLPDGKDPDDFIRQNGAEKYNESRGLAVPFDQFAIDTAVRGKNLSNVKQRTAAIEELLPLVASVKKDIQKRQFFDEVMQALLIEDNDSRRNLWKIVRGNAADTDVKKAVSRSVKGKITVAEQKLLELLIFDRELCQAILPILEPTDTETLSTSEIFSALSSITDAGGEVSMDGMLDLCGDDENAADLVPVLFFGEPKREDGEAIDDVLKEAENCVFTLRSMAIGNRIQELTTEIIFAEQSGDLNALSPLIDEKLELSRILHDLRGKLAGS